MYPIASLRRHRSTQKYTAKPPQVNFNAGVCLGAFRILFCVLAATADYHHSDNHKMEQLLNYGLYANELKHISEVENGLACNCICPNCKHPLVAKNNPTNKKVGHFAHHSGKECEGAIETALHLLAKAILSKTKRLTTPKYHFDYNPNNENSVFKPSRELTFDNIILEKPIDINGEKIIPDAICEINGKQILIEFANTHFIDDGKKEKLKKSGIACIEIDLKGQILDEGSLTNFLNSDTPSKYWIINKRLDKEYTEFKKQQKIKRELEKRRIEEERRIENEKLRIENETKIRLYKNQNRFKIFKADNYGHVSNCPLKKIELQKIKASDFYKHPILKRIIDGEFWNGKIYGQISYGKYIYLKNETIIIYPSDSINVTEKEIRNNKFFHKGLLEILSTIKNPKYGDCKNCQHFIDSYYISEKDYTVCKQKTTEENIGSS